MIVERTCLVWSVLKTASDTSYFSHPGDLHSWGSQLTEECSNRLSRILIRRCHDSAKFTTKLEELTYCGMSISDVFTKDCLRPLHRLHFPEGNRTLRTLASEECFLCCGSDVSFQSGSQWLILCTRLKRSLLLCSNVETAMDHTTVQSLAVNSCVRTTAPNSLRWSWWSLRTTVRQSAAHTTPLSQHGQARWAASLCIHVRTAPESEHEASLSAVVCNIRNIWQQNDVIWYDTQ